MSQETVTTAILLKDLVISIIGVIIVIIAVYFLTKVLKLRYQGWTFSNPKKTAILGLVSIFLSFLLVSILLFTFAHSEKQEIPTRQQFGFGQVFNQIVLALLILSPVLIMMYTRKESWASAGVSRHNLFGSIIVGLFLALVSFFTQGGMHGLSKELNENHFWALLTFGVVGFTEEFMFRGYLQTRLIAWIGRWQGWILTSILMAMAHIVQRITVGGMLTVEGLINSASLIPISLCMGYVMLRTENVIAPAIFHTFVDWVGTLT